jgi:hypothetical protein
MDDSLKVTLEVVDEGMPINMEARKWGILQSFEDSYYGQVYGAKISTSPNTTYTIKGISGQMGIEGALYEKKWCFANGSIIQFLSYNDHLQLIVTLSQLIFNYYATPL